MRFAFLIILLLTIGCDNTSSTRQSTAPHTIQTTSPHLIDYEIINQEEAGTFKMAYDLRVGLVNGRLPSENELAAISRHLRQQDDRRHERTFVVFYLPGMEIGMGAFATAHHLPDLSVAFYPHHLPEKYRRLLPR